MSSSNDLPKKTRLDFKAERAAVAYGQALCHAQRQRAVRANIRARAAQGITYTPKGRGES